MIKTFLIVIFGFCFSFSSFADDKSELPLWEVGVLGGLAYPPQYIGSNEAELKWVLFPNLRYRGKIFRSDDKDGARARITSDPSYRFDISFGGSFAEDSSEARVGMPALDYLVEFGPKITSRLWAGRGLWSDLELSLPVRFVFSVDWSSIKDQGITISPRLRWGRKSVFCKGCELFFSIAARFATERYNDYFYQVERQYETSERSFYESKGGFNGMQYFLGYLLRIRKVQSFIGLSYYDLSGSQNISSPLVKQDWNITLILGFGWLFWESEERGYL